MMDVFFIRHGEYVKAEKDKDCVLTDVGRWQATETSTNLYHKLISSSKCHISTLSSTLQRAKETTKILLHNDDTAHVVYNDYVQRSFF